MILKFEDRGYIDVEKVTVMRWLPRKNRGMVSIGNDRIYLDSDTYKTIETAYIWLHNTHMHDEDMKKMYFVRRTKQKGE